MAVEIKELHIRVAVGAPSEGRPAGAPGPASDPVIDRQAVVAEAVEQVLQVLADRKER